MTTHDPNKSDRMYLYIDDTGSRHLDKKPDPSRFGRDWFALGGYISRQDDEAKIKKSYDDFIKEWPLIKCPLHITDMLSEKKGFSWLGRLDESTRDRFWASYKSFLSNLPIGGTACVIDRPGYQSRGYGSRIGDEKWLLCRSAFDIIVDRACKVARSKGCQLSIEFEMCDRVTDARLKEYYKSLKENGLGFNASTSGKYAPLTKEEFSETLYSIEAKPKASRMIQIADSFVYAISRGKYDRKFGIYRKLVEKQCLINSQLTGEQARTWGIKYYCFDQTNSKATPVLPTPSPTNNKAGE